MNDRMENKSFTEAGSHFCDAIVVTDADGLITRSICPVAI